MLAQRPRHHAPGVLAPDAPLQEDVRGTSPTFEKAGARLRALARFTITARVLSREDYRFDHVAALSPVDLALGWGRMSDSAVLARVDISQSGRFYFWRVQEFPIPEREIIESSANMHLIPADAGVERAIRRTHVGDVVSFEGYLIEASMPDGGAWRSSLTRSDSGAGACEVIWVERFEITPH